MFFSSWLRNLKVRSRPVRRTTGCRLRVESLEERTVLSIFNVTTPLDVVDAGDGLLSLREAVQAANTSPGADNIQLPAGVYGLTLAGAGEDAAATGDLDITDHLSITGAGAGSTVIDGNRLDRVFQVLGAKVVGFSSVTIQGGSGYVFGGGINDSSGGGIFNYNSTIHLKQTVVDGVLYKDACFI
jgi:hypothetical protein